MIALSRLTMPIKWYPLRCTPIHSYINSDCTRNSLISGLRTHCLSIRQQVPPQKFIHSGVNTRQAVKKGHEARLILEHEYNVQKDTLLFRYENKSFLKFINIFAFCQFVFWSHLGYSAFTMMKDVPVSEEDKNNAKLPWWKKMNLGKFRTSMALGCTLIGWGTLAIAWMYTLRSVKLLVLKKGGESLMFVTYSPFLRNKTMTVPLKEVSAKQSRMSSTVQLPLKVKGKFMYFILDMRGEFLNTKLFDYSAGLQRNWMK